MKNRIVLTLFLLVACAWCLVSVSRADRADAAPPTSMAPTSIGGG
jgi:hypothetical protein